MQHSIRPGGAKRRVVRVAGTTDRDPGKDVDWGELARTSARRRTGNSGRGAAPSRRAEAGGRRPTHRGRGTGRSMPGSGWRVIAG